ncbi:MAG TPA: class I SAM-dependent methyltransferase [Vicinamibacterales bacterium]
MAAHTKAYRGIGMEGAIASWYAKNTGRDLSRFIKVADSVRAKVPDGARVLEIAPGPGFCAIEIARGARYNVTGLDISESFVRMARENARAYGVVVDFQLGNASEMPFPDASFDFIVCSAAFKNFSDPVGALNEMHRVLTPGGRASIYDLRKDATTGDIEREVRTMQLSALNAWMTRFTFRFVLLRRAYTRADLERMVAQSHFRASEIVPDGIGFELRLTRPAASLTARPGNAA